ncbi:MAG: flavin-containing monooxygenase [Alphaproteobacteria bacterium]
MAELPRTCIIGAGSSGIATAKIFKENGIPVTVYEKSDRVGGNWVFKNPNGMSSAYRSLHINTSRDKMAYSDFPMPADYPDYPHHTQIAAYFDAYVDHFGIRPHIRFNSGVAHAGLTEDNLWRIELENGEADYFDYLAVANGHHWNPRWPEPPFPGKFEGEELHSHHYIDPTDPIDMRGKRIVLVGFGNSALDLACELGSKTLTEKVYLSVRRGYWVLPRYFGNRVLDFNTPHPSEDPPLWMRLIPPSILRRMFQKEVERVLGRPDEHGLPKPDHEFLATHPAVSQDIYNRIGSGDVVPKPNIERFEGKTVHFTDGSSVEADVVVYCTGYRITFPFFDESLLAAPGNEIVLFKRMIDPRYPNLALVALVQPLCAMMPIAEEQSKFLADYLTGRYALPSVKEMDRDRKRMYEKSRAGYVKTPRHTIQINCGEYTQELRKERARGAKRAARRGNRLPVPRRAVRTDDQKTAAE